MKKSFIKTVIGCSLGMLLIIPATLSSCESDQKIAWEEVESLTETPEENYNTENTAGINYLTSVKETHTEKYVCQLRAMIPASGWKFVLGPSGIGATSPTWKAECMAPRTNIKYLRLSASVLAKAEVSEDIVYSSMGGWTSLEAVIIDYTVIDASLGDLFKSSTDYCLSNPNNKNLQVWLRNWTPLNKFANSSWYLNDITGVPAMKKIIVDDGVNLDDAFAKLNLAEKDRSILVHKSEA